MVRRRRVEAAHVDVDAVRVLGVGQGGAGAYGQGEGLVERDLPGHLHLLLPQAAVRCEGRRGEPGPQQHRVRQRVTGGDAEGERVLGDAGRVQPGGAANARARGRLVAKARAAVAAVTVRKRRRDRWRAAVRSSASYGVGASAEACRPVRPGSAIGGPLVRGGVDGSRGQAGRRHGELHAKQTKCSSDTCRAGRSHHRRYGEGARESAAGRTDGASGLGNSRIRSAGSAGVRPRVRAHPLAQRQVVHVEGASDDTGWATLRTLTPPVVMPCSLPACACPCTARSAPAVSIASASR